VVINGWQAYGSANVTGRDSEDKSNGTPKPWLKHHFEHYGLGEDDLFIRGRSRIHTDNSIEVKYYDKPEKTLDKMAFSLTGALGCEYGSGVSCLWESQRRAEAELHRVHGLQPVLVSTGICSG